MTDPLTPRSAAAARTKHGTVRESTRVRSSRSSFLRPVTPRWSRSSTGTPAVYLGVTAFGQSGDLDILYRHDGLDPDTIVRAALDALHR